MSSEPPVPTKEEVLQEQFGVSDTLEALNIWREREHIYASPTKEMGNVMDIGLFPYHAPGPLPAPIPTVSEIASVAAASHNLNGSSSGDTLHIGPYRVEVAVQPLLLREAATMIYLNQRSDIAPKVYAAFESREVDTLRIGWGCISYYYLITEFFEAERLSSFLDTLDKVQDRAVLEKIGDLLGTTVKKLRSIQPDDPNHFGGLYGQAYRTCNAFRFSKGPDYENYGPFDNYETTVDRLIWASMVTQAMSSNEGWRDYERVLFRDARRILLDSATEEDRKPVLTFFLFMECNILVQLVRDEEGKIIDVKKISFARWEPLGWMPSWYDVAYFQREAKIVHLEKWAPLMQKVLDQIKLANMELADFYDRGLTDMVFPLDVS
ncbi:hypothetical protein BS50DRAFT_640602 [Corynespora cassiicola Philippines]|uniref:Aminoglycoside phosphotransferase domain-containing protein n=1 Tax=Corynespora cassiicola Philippines TaxID=1448308 RepID=A0A2T2N4E0_CORCC|nr:hypothetical protein BS50DRAFT_640602 [Corynespora cassiicola Philippines]